MANLMMPRPWPVRSKYVFSTFNPSAVVSDYQSIPEAKLSLAELGELAYKLQIPLNGTIQHSQREYVLRCIAYLRQHFQDPNKFPLKAPCHVAHPPCANDGNEGTLGGLDPKFLSKEQLIYLPFKAGSTVQYYCMTTADAQGVLSMSIPRHPRTNKQLSSEETKLLRSQLQRPYANLEVEEFNEALQNAFGAKIQKTVIQLSPEEKAGNQLAELLQPFNEYVADTIPNIVKTWTLEDFKLLMKDQHIGQAITSKLEAVSKLVSYLNIYKNLPGQEQSFINDAGFREYRDFKTEATHLALVIGDVTTMVNNKLTTKQQLATWYQNNDLQDQHIYWNPRAAHNIIRGDSNRFAPAREDVYHRNAAGLLHSVNDQPAIIRYYFGGQLKSKTWYKEDSIHRDNDQPAYIEYNIYGQIVEKKWFCNGRVSREHGPAREIYKRDGSVLRQQWYRRGIRHRVDGPALIDYSYNNGQISTEIWYLNDYEYRANGPSETRYYEDGTKKYEGWSLNGRLGRMVDRPSRIDYYENGRKAEESWHIDGKISRKDGPADIKYYENGAKKSEQWMSDNELYRNDGPSMINYYENGQKKSESWNRGTTFNRTDGPALTTYYEDGTKKSEEWYQNDKLHRTDGPALTTYYEDGLKEKEEWYQNDKLHRTDGPALIKYSFDGTIISKYKYRDGIFTGLEPLT